MRPRRVIPGRTYLITRRCSDRRFFLRPNPTTNRIFLYELAKAANPLGFLIHGFVVMSNHIHLVVTDVYGELPNFMHALDLQVSKAVSAEIGRWKGFWEAGTYSAVELLDDDAILEKLAYVEANPVTAGLVRRAKRWPGASSAHVEFHRKVIVRRPKARYYENSARPEFVELELVPPPGMDALETRRRVNAAVAAIQREKEQEMRNRSGKFLGERRVCQQNPYDNPTSWEQRRGRNPTFASRDKWARIEASQRNRSWLEAYREAREKFIAGVRDVVFPAGTWAMARLYGCRCAAAG